MWPCVLGPQLTVMGCKAKGENKLQSLNTSRLPSLVLVTLCAQPGKTVRRCPGPCPFAASNSLG